MDFELSEERRMLSETANRLVANDYPIDTRHAHAAMDEGFDRTQWAGFAELGLIGALLPAEVGGYGGLGEDIAVVFESLGRGLVVEPFLASGILGASPIALAGSDEQKATLEAVMEGTLLLALAHGEPESRYDMTRVTTRAVQEGDGWLLNGAKAVVINGDTADKIVVSARVSGADDAEDGVTLFLVDATQAGVTRRGYPTIDGGRAAEISFANVKLSADAIIGAVGEGFPVIEETLARGVIALGAEALGAMEVSRDLTLEYLKTRKQFGRPIGTFQALQHRMVDIGLEIEQVRSMLTLAAGTLEAERLERERNVSALKNLVGRAGRLVAEEAIQLHGGIAMTWEYAQGHFSKRLIAIDHQLGDTDFHLQRFIQLGQEAA